MDITLSVNNREDVMVLPVTPSSFTISKPQGGNVFETVSQGELQLIGQPKLKGLTIEAFFPIKGHDYSYLHNRDMWGWEYVDKIDDWIDKKLPVRVVISDTPINMAVASNDFEYTIKTDGDLWYKLQLKEFNLLNCSVLHAEKEEEIDMEALKALQEQVEYLISVIKELNDPFIYNYIDENMPEWARESVQAAVDANVLVGDKDNGWGLTYEDLKHITWMHRAGVF